MAAPARARQREPRHLHLPSVHVRRENGTGYDYEEDLFVEVRRGAPRVERVVKLAILRGEVTDHVRVTRDVLSTEEWDWFFERLTVLLEEGNPEAEELMQERAQLEFARQLRIAAGLEKPCLACGCSESRACSGGCIWATANLCSRCFA